MREPDEPLPPEEKLFRKLREHWVDGDRILPDAIDTRGSSCARATFVDAATLTTSDYPKIGVITVKDLPSGIVVPNTDGTPWEAFAFDCPEEGNEPHAEVRVRRHEKRPDTDNDSRFPKKPETVKTWVKDQIAQRFRVAI